MNARDTLLAGLPKIHLRIHEPNNHKLQDLIQKEDTCIKVFEDAHREYEATGRLPNASTYEELKLLYEERAVAAETINENVEPPSEDRSSRQTRTRQTRSRRPAARNVTASIDSGVVPNGQMAAIEETAELNIKKKDKSAPLKRPPRQKKKKETKTVKTDKNSNVIIQDQTITVVNLVDGSDEERKNVRQTRARTKRKAKTSRTSGSDVESKNEKRFKSNEQEKGPKEELSPTKEINTMYVVSTTEPPAMNATFVVQNPVCVKNEFPQSVNDMKTDVESKEELVAKNKTLSAYTGAIPKHTKSIFKPFEQNPVKTKVQGLVNLWEERNLLVHTNRTTTKSKQKNEANVDEVTTSYTQGNVKEKAKIFAPAMTKFLPGSQSTSVTSAQHISVLNDTWRLGTPKPASGLKASLEEHLEKVKRKQERERQVSKWREIMMQIQTQERKHKREMKHLKAQQQREAVVKEKLEVLEAQRLKDERHRQVLAEQEEKKNKEKEEAEKKRMMAKLKAREEKKREVDVDQLMQKKNVKYLCSKAPLLPTPDCYDSDDERYQPDLKPPAWTNDVKSLCVEATKVGETMKNRYFSIQAQTPDLQDIFTTIAPEKLKRSSSALWHKPPRYTMVPVLENHDQTEEFDYSD